MQELTTQQKFEASLVQGNCALAECYLTDFFHRNDNSVIHGGDYFKRMKDKFGLIATAEVVSRIYSKLSGNSHPWQKTIAAGFLRDHSAALFQETTSGLARKVAHVLLNESHSSLGRPILNLDRLCAAWTPEHIEANPAEAARTAILGGSAPLFSQALEVCVRKDGMVAAVALIEEGLPRTSLFSPPSPLLPAMTGFLKNHVTSYVATTSAETALSQVLFLSRFIEADGYPNRDLVSAVETLMKSHSPTEVLDLVQPKVSGGGVRPVDPHYNWQSILLSLQKQAWTDYVADLRNSDTKPGKVLSCLADRIGKMPSNSKIRPQAVQDYISVLRDIPDPSFAVDLATRHLNPAKEIFHPNETTTVVTAVSDLLAACDLTDQPEHWLHTLSTLLCRQRRGATVPALSSGLTVTLNALAQKDPPAALQEAIKLGEQAFVWDHHSVDGAAAAAVETTASLLAERGGPAKALEMLLASYSPNYGFERRPAVEYALNRSIKTLEQQVFPPALQPPVAA